MTDVIYERGAAREAMIWDSFSYSGPFDSVHATERTILFGLYANTYLHGHNYLNEIETEDLSRLVDTYNNNIAMLTNDQAQAVLEVSAKRYIENIAQHIHEENLVTLGQKIDSRNDVLDAEFDVYDLDYSTTYETFTASMIEDYEALVTKRAEVQLAWDKADQKIKDLELHIELEDVNYQMVGVEITEQELRSARADLEIIEAGLKGLDIQLSITQTGIDITNTTLQITEAESRVDEIGIQVSETEVQESGVELDIIQSGINLSKSEAAGERIKVDSQGVSVRVAETELQTVETEAKHSQIDAEISKINADKARLELIDSEKALVVVDKRIIMAENALLVKEKGLIDDQGQNVIDETDFRKDQKEVQENLDEKILEHDQSGHDFDIDMSRRSTAFEDNLVDIKTGAFETKKTLADAVKASKIEDANDRTALDESRAEVAGLLKDAAIEAARAIANSNITNTLTHSIGAA